MNIGQISVKGKYFVLSLSIAIAIFGLFAAFTLKTQLSPDTSAPAVTVLTQYPGASAQDVTADVVEPMEDVFGTLDGVSEIKATAQDNIATIRLEFTYGSSVDQASIDVQNALSRIREQLPDTIKEPQVLKFSTSDKPVVTVSLKSNTTDLCEVRQIAEDRIGFELQLVDGVASVNYFGGNRSEIQVVLDRNRMEAYGLSYDQVNQTLVQNNVKAPGGKVVNRDKEIIVRVDAALEDLSDLETLRFNLSDGTMVYLKDVAEVSLSSEELESTYHYNGEDAIAIMVTKKSDANTVDVVESIKSKLDILRDTYPYIQFELAQDDSIFTNQMIENMRSSVALAILFTMVIILLFITNISQSMVISISMPLVFLTTLALMKMADMKLDMVTLSALILSIGFVVDGAIVVVENIMHHFQEGSKSISDAAVDGTNEIALPSIAGATTTLIVLFPLLFIEGFVGEMFRPLSMTLIFAITASIAIALIIIPLFTVILSRFKFSKAEKMVSRVSMPFNQWMDRVLNVYIGLLRKSLRHKWKLVGIVGILLISSLAFILINGIEMLPKFDGGTTFVSIEMEQGSQLEKTKGVIEEIQAYLDEQENVLNYDAQIGYEKESTMLSDFGVMGENQALITVNLSPRNSRKESIWTFQEKLRKRIALIPDVERYVVKEKGGTATSSSTAPIDVIIKGDNQEILHKIAVSLEEAIRKVEGTTNVYMSFNMDNQELTVVPNLEKLQNLGLTSAALAQQIYRSVEGVSDTEMDIQDTDALDILLIYDEKYRSTDSDLMDLSITAPSGVRVPLRSLASVEMNKRSNMVTKENLEYTIDILGYTDDRAYSHVTGDINEILRAWLLPSGYSAALTGESADMGESMQDMLFLLGLAVIFVYLVLVPQFNSFIHPITIMASIPLVIIGIAPALAISGKYVSMPVLLGFILLAGTVVNNAILVIDYALKKQEEGLGAEAAVIEAVKSRYRPIMMTAFSDVVGMMPLALQLALGSERFSPLAITVIGGILSATFLTMIVIPVLFVTFQHE